MTAIDKQRSRIVKLEAQLEQAKEIIKKMLPLLPRGYNDMGNTDFIFDVREEAEQFLQEE